ncbi:ABC transporter permease [Deinococcus aquiradiocola]|uniref:Sugar ABC transporter permease n=1 Tax=Deinococcus aquiradiocola TaxID=393059 RepID=A0A917PBL0_9DEIO|nr:ABC transporter permease [Deinococcus aquiradiocola]GGJ69958.1 sugar ABC transporter permease [Deinococcus aquiradiocola]
MTTLANAKKPPARRRVQGVSSALVALVALVLFNAVTTPNFLTLNTLNINLTQTATIVIVGIGMTFVIATRGIDLSVGSLMAISGALAPVLFLNERLGPNLGVTLSILLPVLAAGLFGAFNGLLVTRFRIQPIIATLVLFIAGRGIAQVISGGALVNFTQPSFTLLGTGRVLGISVQVLLMLALLALAAWALRATLFGRYVIAVGGNADAARLAGVPVTRTKLLVYTLSGLLAGLAGLIVIAVNSSSDSNLVGQNMELDAIAAVAVGGTSLNGGRVTMLGTLLGALFIQLLRYTLLVKGIPDAAALMVKAAIIVGAVALQYRRS